MVIRENQLNAYSRQRDMGETLPPTDDRFYFNMKVKILSTLTNDVSLVNAKGYAASFRKNVSYNYAPIFYYNRQTHIVTRLKYFNIKIGQIIQLSNTSYIDNIHCGEFVATLCEESSGYDTGKYYLAYYRLEEVVEAVEFNCLFRKTYNVISNKDRLYIVPIDKFIKNVKVLKINNKYVVV